MYTKTIEAIDITLSYPRELDGKILDCWRKEVINGLTMF